MGTHGTSCKVGEIHIGHSEGRVIGHRESDWDRNTVMGSGTDEVSDYEDSAHGGKGSCEEVTCDCSSYCKGFCGHGVGGRVTQGKTHRRRLAPAASDLAQSWEIDGGLYLERGSGNSSEPLCCPCWRRSHVDGASWVSLCSPSSPSGHAGCQTPAGVSSSSSCGHHWGSLSSSASCVPCPYSSFSWPASSPPPLPHS